ncbi:MAG TPA: acyl-CoA dehydrogenase C-terminal domain-containing protein [Gemmatimonadaceae bacterium]|nr:acyl-CoA dehydrogenase C-terminal domain-containing protein [Gemmatimonadaceae bacterium]
MPTYKAPLDDIRFLLNDVLDVGQLAALPGYADATPDLLGAVMDEAAKLCEEVLQPLNQTGDAEGCHYENGVVRTPNGFREGYNAYRDGGWPAMVASPEFGGQGLPHVAGVVLDEMLCSSNLSFSMYPLLAHGAVGALERWGDEELKHRFLPRLVDGSWAGTMCLTEPHAGTDLGMIRTRAVAAGDGAYLVTGTKIFISAGEHDLTDNIIHLVLARLPDAPAGTKGISLFLVPKRLPTEEGLAGSPNGVTCGSIEHKMGIKANATCVMNFENARGWLVGEPHKGMRAMFTMMNGARLGVGMQGLGLAEVSYQNALAYTKERLQGRSVRGPHAPNGDADPIIVHPDVRRMLLTMKAYIEGVRALAYWVGILIDVEERHPDAAKREEAADLVALMTPVIKAFGTDVGFDITNLALQCFGGHGYIREYGMEQFVRDSRIAQIYEGTNGVQAMDLLGRKVPDGNGRMVRRFVAIVERDLTVAAERPALRALAEKVRESLRALVDVTGAVMARAAKDPDEIGAAAADYLRAFGLVATGWMWMRMATVADSGESTNSVATSKVATAEFYVAKLLPATYSLVRQIDAGAATVMSMDAAAF